jgi:hypothetical protein
MTRLPTLRTLIGIAGLWLLSVWAWAGSPVWQLEGSAQPFFIAGTIHVLRAEDYPLPKALEQAYQASDVLVLEMDLSAATQEYFRQQMARVGLYPVGENIRQALSPEVLSKVEQQLTKDHLTLVQVQQQRPWLLSLTLMHLELQRQGVSPEYGIDMHYYQRAIADKKTVQALETADAQLNVLTDMGNIAADSLVTQFIDDIGELPKTLGVMTAAWRTGDYAVIDQELTARLRTEQPAFYQSILVDRNQRWLGELEKHMQSGKPVLVLVGSAHLAGPDSLINMLAERGHRFTEVDEVQP